MRRVLAIAHKELLHVLRDPRSLALAVAMPLMMVLLYGFAIDMEMKRLKIAVLDLDQSRASRDLIRRLTSSRFIIEAARLDARDAIEPGFRRGAFRAAIVIPEGYAESIVTAPVTSVQVLVDGADGTTATAVSAYLNATIGLVNRDIMSERFAETRPFLEMRSRVFYNPELVSAHFIVPGLAAIILIMICVLLTSIAITREKETGTMEQILTTPVRSEQVIIGKVIPYFGIGTLDAALVMLLGRLVFGVPMEGSWLVLTGYGLLYVLIALSLGLLISAVVRTQQLAMTLALMGTLMPSIMLSGFIFPISSMPPALQALSYIIPARYFIEILRGIMLRGDLWYPKQLAVMTFMAVGLLALAARKFQSRRDLV